MFYEAVVQAQKLSCRAFFFYSGAFGIELFFTVLLFFLPLYLKNVLFASSNMVNGFLTGTLVSGLIFIPIFGFFASISQSIENQQKKIGTLMLAGFGALLVIFSLLFSALPMLITVKSEGNNLGVHILAMIFCFLFMAGFYGYMVTFFSISSHFSYGIVSRFALPIWSGLGQLTGFGVIYLFQDLSKNSSQTFWGFLVCCAILVVLSLVSLTTAYASVSLKYPTIKERKFFGSNSWWSIVFDSWAYSGVAAGFIVNGFNLFGSCSLAFLAIFFNGWLPEGGVSFSSGVLNHIKDVNVLLKIRSCQQVVQILSSILFGLVEFVVFLCTNHKTMLISPNTAEYQEKNLKNIESSYIVRSFRVRWITTLLSMVSLTAVTYTIRSYETGSELLTLIKIGMTGLGSAAIYSSREFQFILARLFDRCLFLRQKDRKQEFYTHFEFRDRVINVILFSFCQQIALTFTTISALFFVKFNVLTLFWYSAFFGFLSISFLLCFFPCCFKTSDFEKSKTSGGLVVKADHVSKNPTFQRSFKKSSSLRQVNNFQSDGQEFQRLFAI